MHSIRVDVFCSGGPTIAEDKLTIKCDCQTVVISKHECILSLVKSGVWYIVATLLIPREIW